MGICGLAGEGNLGLPDVDVSKWKRTAPGKQASAQGISRGVGRSSPGRRDMGIFVGRICPPSLTNTAKPKGST